MSHLALTCEELLADFNGTASRWLIFLAAHPEALDVPCDIANAGTVGGLVWHIYSVSVRHSQRLLEEEVSAFAEGPDGSLETIRDLMQTADDKLRRFLGAVTEEGMTATFTYTMRSGPQLSASRRKLFVHIMVHAMRHWAQITTLLRQNGLKPDWGGDFYYSNALD